MFPKEINKIVLSSNCDERMQSIGLIETYAYVVNIDLVSEKEVIKCNNIIKRYKKWLTFMILLKKIEKDIIEIA